MQLFFHSGCLEVFVSIAKCFAAPYSYNRLVTYGWVRAEGAGRGGNREDKQYRVLDKTRMLFVYVQV